MTETDSKLGELIATTKILCERVNQLTDKLDKVLPQISVLTVELEEQKKTVQCHSQEIKRLTIWGVIILAMVGGTQLLEKILK